MKHHSSKSLILILLLTCVRSLHKKIQNGTQNYTEKYLCKSVFKSVLICVIATSGSEERKTVSGGQFKWGTFLLKSNGEVQRSANSGWKSEWSRKGKSRLYCETDMSSSWETRT